jgi:hypothetical protein
MFDLCNTTVDFTKFSRVCVCVCVIVGQQLALGMVIPSLELTGWSGHQLQSSIPTVYTTLKLVASKRKVADLSSVVDGSAPVSQLEDVDVVASTGARGRLQLTDR